MANGFAPKRTRPRRDQYAPLDFGPGGTRISIDASNIKDLIGAVKNPSKYLGNIIRQAKSTFALPRGNRRQSPGGSRPRNLPGGPSSRVRPGRRVPEQAYRFDGEMGLGRARAGFEANETAKRNRRIRRMMQGSRGNTPVWAQSLEGPLTNRHNV